MQQDRCAKMGVGGKTGVHGQRKVVRDTCGTSAAWRRRLSMCSMGKETSCLTLIDPVATALGTDLMTRSLPLRLLSISRRVHQRRAHRGGGLPAVRGVFGEGALDYFGDSARHVGGALQEWNNLAFEDSSHRGGDVVGRAEVERRVAGEQAVCGHADRVDVGG